MKKTIRVLVVDDSKLIRTIIGDLIDAEEGMEVVGMAASGEQALEMIPLKKPDIITLDVEMPGMGGLDTLRALMQRSPLPVIMVSAFTKHGAELTRQALEELGALDFVAKPDAAHCDDAFGQHLVGKLRNLAGADVERILRIRRGKVSRAKVTRRHQVGDWDESSLSGMCVALGISTGGPPALSRVFQSMKRPFPAVLIVQHMPKMFTRSLADRLNGSCDLTVVEASDGQDILPNHVYIAPGGRHMGVHRGVPHTRIRVFDAPPVTSHRPSVDVMMSDVADVFKERVVGVIMTGMGRDGVEGCRRLREHGVYVLGQDERSSDVYGMNKAAFVEGHVDEQFDLAKLPSLLHDRVGKLHKQLQAT